MAITSQGDSIRIGNEYLEREIDTGSRLRTTRLFNKLTGATLAVTSQEFVIRLNDEKPNAVTLTTEDFIIQDRKQSNTDGGGKRITFALRAEKHGVSVDVTYEISRPDDFYIRKQLVIHPGPHLVNWVEVERFDVPANVTLAYGQENFHYAAEGRPIYIGRNLFAGLEYPAGYNVRQGQTVHLRHYPGRTGDVTSRRAVIGVCADKPGNRITDAILRYVTRERSRRVKHVTGWYDYFNNNYSDADCEKHITEAASLFGPDKVKLDFVSIDGGWANPKSIMREHPDFPGRLGLIKKLAKEKLDAGLALHICTAGGRTTVDAEWVKAHYDVSELRGTPERPKCFYCLADPRAHRDLKESLLYLIRKYDVEAFKFDWQSTNCDKAGHRGHLPGSKYGREAIIDSYLAILEALRKEKPDILLYNWAWPSPFWTLWYDAVFTHGIGGEINTSRVGPPAFTMSSLMCTAKDEELKRRFYDPAPYFPTTDFMTSEPFRLGWGNWRSKYIHEDTQRFIDWIITSYMRGSQMTELVMSQFGSEETQKAHITASKWRRANDALIMGKTRFFGGSPLNEEPYGYGHFDEKNKGLVLVRNPSVLPKEIAVSFDETIGMLPGGPVVVNAIYPYLSCLSTKTTYGESLNIRLHSFETVVLEVGPGLTPRTDRRKAPAAKIQTTSLTIAEGKDAVRCSFEAEVPERHKADLIVLVRRAGVDATIQINGQATDVEAPHKELRDCGKPAQAADWSMFRTRLQPGQNRVTFELPQQGGEWRDLPFSPSARMTDIMYCLLDVEIDCGPAEKAPPGELPGLWRGIKRDTIVLHSGSEAPRMPLLPFEIYTVQADSKLYTDRDYRIVSIPKEFIGKRSIRFSHVAAKNVATIRFYAKKPIRVFVAFGDLGQWLTPQPGWKIYKKNVFKAVGGRCTPDIYFKDFPEGEVTLFLGQKGNFAVVGIRSLD
ncbi:MAG: hypothetical protein GXP25_13075 [Planctomycetes bacterium]|nr:hypothetical protein [Planctomycetota bacterium]